MLRRQILSSLISFVIVLVSAQFVLANEITIDPKPDRLVVFKKIGDTELKLHVFDPADDSDRSGAAIVFFFGGGWVGGSPSQFYPQCQYLSDRGMVAISAEYRVRSRDKTTPFECVKDGKSAVRWVRAHAAELRIKPDKIVASGGSAGGHVAACTALIDGLDEETDVNLGEMSCVPNSLILFNPVIDTSEIGFGYKQLGDRYREISPLEHVRSDLPPTLILQGLADTTTPPSGHREFERRMVEHANKCRLVLYPDKEHGFFNPGRDDNFGYNDTTNQMSTFLKSLGFLKNSPIK